MEFINGDCMDYMKDYPDNYFDLAIVDPPYGAGFTEGGGCKGWFSKYHQINEGGCGEHQIRQGSAGGSTVTRTGGTWARKYTKKSLRGMLRRIRNTLQNFSASHVIRSYGAATILNCQLPDVF